MCEACHCRAAPASGGAARRYRRPKPPPPPKPTRYAALVGDVLAALKRSSMEATGWEWSIGGLGAGEGRYTGWCPVCARGLVDIQILNTDPPRARTDGCTNGCSPDLICDAVWPPLETSPPTTSTARRRGRQLGKARPKGILPPLPRGRDLDLIRDFLDRAFRPGATGDGTASTASTCSSAPADSAPTRARSPSGPAATPSPTAGPTQSQLIGPQLRANVLAITDGWCDMPHLTGSEQDDVWAGLVKLGKVVSEVDDRDEARKWVQNILDAASPLRGYTLVPDGRHDALMALRNHGEFKRPDAELFVRPSEENSVRRPVRFVDDKTGEQFLRAGETITFVRYVAGERSLQGSTLRARLSEIGVQAVRFEHHLQPAPEGGPLPAARGPRRVRRGGLAVAGADPETAVADRQRESKQMARVTARLQLTPLPLSRAHPN